jgi:hypothetical protein
MRSALDAVESERLFRAPPYSGSSPFLIRKKKSFAHPVDAAWARGAKKRGGGVHQREERHDLKHYQQHEYGYDCYGRDGYYDRGWHDDRRC